MNENKDLSRRGFLKVATAIGAALTFQCQNYRIVKVLHDFGRTRGMTASQLALGWLLHKAPWIVPIPGTTKISHLEENLHSLDFQLADSEWQELEARVSAIPVIGDRYNAEQQKQVGF